MERFVLTNGCVDNYQEFVCYESVFRIHSLSISMNTHSVINMYVILLEHQSKLMFIRKTPEIGQICHWKDFGQQEMRHLQSDTLYTACTV